MAVVSVIAMGNTDFGKKLTASQITSLVTVGDLYKLLMARLLEDEAGIATLL